MIPILDEFEMTKLRLEQSANFSHRPAPTTQQVYDAMHSKFAYCYAHSKLYNMNINGDIHQLNPLTGEREYRPEDEFWVEWNGTEYVPIYRA